MEINERQLSFGSRGHFINHTNCFSQDDQWIVFDTRNDDNRIIETGTIGIINVNSGEVKDLYHTENQSEFGPGVGAASFFPSENRILFLHGIRNASKQNPYSFARRSGVAIDVESPFAPKFMDARNICSPFTKGALRGGSHAHSVSGDGQWISFTYNDFIIQQIGQENPSIKDLRTVGVMVPGKVEVDIGEPSENFAGEMFSVVIAEVIDNPRWGSDEIDKAFDETWVGNDGYIKDDGTMVRRAIAFQGNIKESDGRRKTEIFIADLPEDIKKERNNKPLEGTSFSRLNVPAGVRQRRITFSDNGIQGPRHWLRSANDGSVITFLSEDDQGVIQIFGVSPNGGKIKQFTKEPFSVEGPFNISPDDRLIAYIADNSIYLTILATGVSKRISKRFSDEEKPVGGVVWSRNGKMLAYNRYVKTGSSRIRHIFLLNNFL
jgi:hypothetical protein